MSKLTYVPKKLDSAINSVARWCPDIPYMGTQSEVIAQLRDANDELANMIVCGDHSPGRLSAVFKSISGASDALESAPPGSGSIHRSLAVWKLDRASKILLKVNR